MLRVVVGYRLRQVNYFNIISHSINLLSVPFIGAADVIARAGQQKNGHSADRP